MGSAEEKAVWFPMRMRFVIGCWTVDEKCNGRYPLLRDTKRRGWRVFMQSRIEKTRAGVWFSSARLRTLRPENPLPRLSQSLFRCALRPLREIELGSSADCRLCSSVAVEDEGGAVFQVRIHGRGGQGVVSGAEMLSVAAFLEDKHAQAFPSFGSERMGAPVVAFCRIDDKAIRLREPVMEPDALIIQDPTLLHVIDVFGGLTETGYVLINTSRAVQELGIDEAVQNLPTEHVCSVPATELALQYVKRPVPNAALLGALSAVSNVIEMDSVVAAIQAKFPGKVGEANVIAAKAAYEGAKSN